MRYPASAYRQFSVQGATPLGLVVMLYDGAIRFLRQAEAAIEAHDVPKKCEYLNRAVAIIAQLEGTLNFELGGEVAQTLKSLYVYSRTQITKANIENSAETLRSLIEKLSGVREAWYEADRRLSTSATADAAQEPTPSSPTPPEAGSYANYMSADQPAFVGRSLGSVSA